MINNDKWINSLPKNTPSLNKTIDYSDSEKWLNTIPKKDKYSSAKKKSFLGVLFIFGLILVSVVKNETRALQKEIDSLQSSLEVVKFNLDQAILDNEVITSPENISLLAKQYLNSDLTFYKRSQIINLGDNHDTFSGLKNKKKEKVNFFKKVQKKKVEVAKLTLYNDPQSIPSEIKKKVGKGINKKKDQINKIYESPSDFLTLQKVTRWSAIQVVKAFLGMPAIPGR